MIAMPAVALSHARGRRPGGVGPLVKEWRTVRRRSQLDLALEIGVSARHLSFVETGRSRPSPELILALAEGLDVPLRDRNALLLAAGYAPRLTETSLDSPAMATVRGWLERMLAAHDPYPGAVIDRQWNIVLANRSAGALVQGVSEEAAGPTLNVFRLCLHPDGLAARTLNFEEWAAYLLRQLHRLVATTNDRALRALEEEVAAYPTVAALPDGIWRAGWVDAPLLVPLRITTGGRELSLFTTLTTFGTPTDITLAELALELFYPADDASGALLASLVDGDVDGDDSPIADVPGHA
jgi:transcriptional regulator with XRE-family HTH domain